MAQGSHLSVPSGYRKNVETVLSQSGKNRQELERFLFLYSKDLQMLEAASFLVAHLPLSDAVSMTAEDLREHVDYAFLARRLMPWGQDVPWNLFLHYVVPHRISQEPFQRWRKRFFLELVPHLQKCRTVEDAIQEINKWCFLKADFVSSAPHDQGPLTTILRGKGRCEELVILAAAAARSVGIPVRPCYTPAWQFTNGNHAWLEVWTGGGWHYLGAGEPTMGLNRTSFSQNTPFMVLALSSAYGDMQTDNESIYRLGSGFTLLNSTSAYTDAFPLRVSVVGNDGTPVPDAVVFASIYNSGTFRPVARILCNEKGEGFVELGQSTVLLTVAKKGKTDYEFIRIAPDSSNGAALDLRRDRLPSGDFFLPFGTREKDSPDDNTTAQVTEAKDHLASQKERLRASRQAEFDGYKRIVAGFLGISEKDTGAWENPLARALLASGGNCFELIRSLATVPAGQAETLKAYIVSMDEKDRIDSDAPSLLAEVRTALESRRKIRSAGLCSYDNETFVNFVLNNRVHHESHSHWRPFLKERFTPFMQGKGDLKLLVRRVNEYVSTLDKIDRGILGPLMPPDAIVRAGRVTSEEERAIASVAILRALGVPARYLRQWDWVEYFTGTEWLPLYPDNPRHLGNRNASELSRNVYAEPAQIEITFFRDGKPCSEKEMAYKQDFSLSRFDEEGLFHSLLPDGTFDEKRSAYRLKIPAGHYFIIAARRNPFNEPSVKVLSFSCKPGQKKSFRIDL